MRFLFSAVVVDVEQARTLAATVKREHYAGPGDSECITCCYRWPCRYWRLADAVETLTAPPRSDEIADRYATLVGQPMRVGYLAAIRDYCGETGAGVEEAKDAIDAALTRRDEATRR